MSKNIAIHEAGHAVVGRALGLRGGTATLVPNEASSERGHATTFAADHPGETIELDGSPFARPAWLSFRARILTLMAGAEAERELLGLTDIEDADDRLEIARLAAAPESGLLECFVEYEPRMRMQTRRIVRRYKSVIEDVATALLDQMTLSSEDIDALV
jgi:ATP-dependent Zn protease